MNNFLGKFFKIFDYIKSLFKKIDEWSDKNFFKFFIFVFLFKSFIFDISMVPSCSMTPSAQTGDLVFVNKMSYGINRNSIQWIGGYLPFFKSKWFSRKIKRGETLIFTLPRDPKTIYFKRIIAIEGDSIQMINGILHINDKPVKMESIGPYEVLSDDGDHVVKGTKYLITLEDGTSYTVFRHKNFGTHHRDNTIKYFVPKGYVWAQGDNHTGSDDCFAIDFMGAEGIPVDNIIGKPILTICGSNSRQKEEPHWMAWFISLPIRIPTYIVNLDFSRFFKKYN